MADKQARLSAEGLSRSRAAAPPPECAEAAAQAAVNAVAIKPTACSACRGGPGEPLWRCDKFSSVWYCSREYQTRTWLEHRRKCGHSKKQQAGGCS